MKGPPAASQERPRPDVVAEPGESPSADAPPSAHPEPAFPLPAVFAEFRDWAERHGGRAEGAALEEGLTLARQRREVLKGLIQANPQAALAAALPWRLRKNLPASVVELLEERISSRGDFSVLAAVPHPGERTRTLWRTAMIGGREYEAFVHGRREGIGSKRRLPIEGIAVDDKLAVLDAPLRRLEDGEPVPASPPRLVAEAVHGAAEPAETFISGGVPYRVCCAAHAAELEAELAAAEFAPGPELAASGGGMAPGDGGVPVAASSWTEGNKTLLAIRVDFPDWTGEPFDGNGDMLDAALLTSRVIGGVTDFLQQCSYGKASMSLAAADVTAVLRMPQNASVYALGGLNNALRTDALALAEAAGFNPDNYSRVALVFRNIGASAFPGSLITYGGLAQIGDKFSWYNGTFSLGVAAHEFGHNHGLRHANLWQIPGGSSNPVDPAGTSVEYGDVFDMMGSGPSSSATQPNFFNPWFQNRLDWLPNAAVQVVATGGVHRVFRHDHLGASLANTLALKVERNNTQRYWISYRRKYAGHPTHADASAGAVFVWGYDNGGVSNLLDLDTPGADARDASLNVGSTFHDNAAGLHFTVVGAGGSGTAEYLDISIAFDSRLSFSQTSYDADEAGGALTISLLRSGSSAGATSVRVKTADGTAVSSGPNADYGPVDAVVNWADGDAAPKTVVIPVNADAVAEGSESFTIQLSDVSGGIILNESTATAFIREPGAADASFSHGFFNYSGSARRLALEPSGRIAFVGAATILSSVTINGLGRLEASGTMDGTFNQGAGADVRPVKAIARQPDGKILIAGNFASVRGTARNRIARLSADGNLDTTFNPGAGPDNEVRAMALQPDGRIVIAGVFQNVSGTPRRGLARLLADGSLDGTFLATPITGLVAVEAECLALQSDGKILAGGLIYSDYEAIFPGGFASGILRFTGSGELDASFNIGAGAHAGGGSVTSLRRVLAIDVQRDGGVVIGGEFTGFNTVDAGRIARLNPDGSVDNAFVAASGAGADGIVRTVLVQGDGKIVCGGDFGAVNALARPRVARLLAGGGTDSAFDAGISPTFGAGSTNRCYHLLQQPDTRLLLALDEYGSGQTALKRVFSAQPGTSGVVEFSAGSFNASEGGTAQLTLERTGGSFGAISVSYATIPGSAGAADFSPATGTVTWADGDTAQKTISIPVSTDLITEPVEYFTVQLGIPIGGASFGTRALASVDILGATPIESWRQTHFGATDNSGNGANGADPDKDGVVNLIEYALGRLPTSGSSPDGATALPVVIQSADPLFAGRLVIECNLPEPSRADLTHLVEVSGNPEAGPWVPLAQKSGAGSWTWLGGGTARLTTSAAGGRSIVRVGDTQPATAGTRRFLRLRVTNP